MVRRIKQSIALKYCVNFFLVGQGMNSHSRTGHLTVLRINELNSHTIDRLFTRSASAVSTGWFVLSRGVADVACLVSRVVVQFSKMQARV